MEFFFQAPRRQVYIILGYIRIVTIQLAMFYKEIKYFYIFSTLK